MTQSIGNQVHLKGLSGTFKGREFIVSKDEFIVGRLPECDMVIMEDTISSRHAKIVKGEEHFEIQDLNSTNGTFVNDEIIDQKILRTNDKIKFDVYEFQFFNPSDVPRTVLADYPGDKSSEETEVHPAARETLVEEKTLKLPTQDQAAPLPEYDQTVPLPVEERTEPIKEEKPKQQKRPSPYKEKKGGNAAAGLILGILLAVVIGYIGTFLGAWSSVNYSTANIQQLLLGSINIYHFYHVPTLWLNVQFTFSTIITILGIILGLIAGGWVTKHISRRSRVIGSFFFALFYMIIVLIAQLAVMEFRFAAFKSSYNISAIGFQEPLINLALTIGSIFVLGFIFSFIGSLLSRK